MAGSINSNNIYELPQGRIAHGGLVTECVTRSDSLEVPKA